MEHFFKLQERGTDVRTEVMAGLTTFMTMAYILAVNPGILSAAGMDAGAITLEDLTTGKSCELVCDFTERQKDMLKAGGLLAYTAQF